MPRVAAFRFYDGAHIGCWDETDPKTKAVTYKSKHWAPETQASRIKRRKS